MRFTRSTADGSTEYRAEGESFRYVAKRVGKDRWSLVISKLETVAGIRVAVKGSPFNESWHDTLTTCKAVAAEFEALGDGYKSAEHGHRERYTEAVLKAYGQADQPVCETPADTAKITSAITDTDKGDTATMAEKTAETTTEAPEVSEFDRIVEEVHANIERAKSLAEVENVDALKELSDETEALISKLPTSGKGAPRSGGWTKYKKAVRDEFRAAATVQEKPAKKAEVAKKAAAPVLTYDQYEGVSELVEMGAATAAESVRLHIKTATTAKELAEIGLDMWRRMPNKDNNPDILGESATAIASSKALKKAAGEALAAPGDLDAFDVEEALKKLWRAVQNQRADVRAKYLRDLDNEGEDAEKERARFANILKDKPEDVPASKWVADAYGVSLIGPTELSRQRYHEKMAALAEGKTKKEIGGGGGGGDDVDEDDENQKIESGTSDEHALAVVDRIVRDIMKGKPEEFEKVSEEAKAKIREKLEQADQALKAMRRAAL